MKKCLPEKRGIYYLTSTVFLLLLLFAHLPALSQSGNVEVCNDNVDNDGDGVIDCNDSFCQFAANIERGCRCYDNIDNDGDGKIDKADSNCATYYGLTFVGEGSNCSITPPGAATPFDLVGPPAVSGQNTADTQSKVAVGDVDNDGIPDVVITSKWNSEIRVVATSNGQPDGSDAGDIKADYNLDGSKIFSGSGDCDPKNILFEHEVLIADIDKDGKAELFGVASNRKGSPSSPPTCFFLVGFRYGSTGPGGLVPLYDAVQLGTDRPGTFGIADMDGDGKAEVYLRDRIYAAETGALLAAGNGDWDLDVTSGPVAVNISGDNKMELVCGTKIFSIPTLTNRNPAIPGSLTLVSDMNAISADKCFVKLMLDPVEYGEDTHSACSVADIDRDGVVDVIISGALNSPTGETAVFYWNVAKNKVSYYIATDPSYANGWPWGTGRVNLGDANGDGKTDLSFIAGNQLFCLTTDAGGNLIPLWAAPRIINDTRSGVLTVSIYDFDNDGNPEMVYRDSQEIVIIDGTTGTQKLWSAICQSHTYTEGPVIADANGDGATDICVSCNRNNSFSIDAGIQQQALGEVRMFFSSGNEWLPTRKVWNQPGYFVVNINDDLTLPFPQLDQNVVFGNSPCPNGIPGPQMPMNVFLNQVPFLSSDGCPVFPAPDLSFVGDDPENLPYPPGDPRNFPAVVVIPPICGNLDIKVSFNIINDGDLPISAAIPVSFFHGDPTEAGITSDSLLFSTTINVVNLQVDDTITTVPVTFNGPGTPFRLYIVLNNNGSVLPINPNGSVSNECRIDNNIYDVFVTPTPFTATIEKIKDNFKCGPIGPDNGELRAHIFKGAVEVVDYSPYAFAWRNAANVVVSTNYNATGLPEGTYSLVVTNTQKGCSSVPVFETIVKLGNDPDVSIIVKSHQTQCSPPNGQLEAVIAGGNTGFTFEWYDVALTPLGITGPIANNLTAGNYLVYVSKDGCTKVSPPAVIDGPQIPDAQAQTLQNIVNCTNLNSGSISADAMFNGVIQDPTKFTFDWYFYNNATATRGSILPPLYGTGQTRTGLPIGYYQVVIRNIATQCLANQAPIAQITDQTVLPTALITILTPQTSCDLANPNGRLAADVQIGGVTQNPSGFTFQWFRGDNTLPANLHTNVSDVNGRVAEAVPGGGVYYTVKVTTANNCSDTEKIIITEDVNLPVVTLTPVDNSICDPALAGTAFNGRVTASVTFKGVAITDFTNYQFKWYDGSQTTDPAIAVTNDKNPLLSQLDDGFYTVTAKRLDLSCLSAPVTAQVKNATVLPAITALAIPSTNCDPLIPNGSAAVTDVDGLGIGSPYTFKWYDGNAVVAGSEKSLIASYPNLNGGPTALFTVLVTNQNSGCQRTATVQVADSRVLPLLSLAPSPNTICDPALTNPSIQYDGQVLTTITNQGANPIADYTFAWSNSAVTKDLLNVKDASYTLTVTHTPTRCVSDPAIAQVLNQTALPVINAAGIASTNCIPALANGQAIVNTVDGNPAAAPYVFLWHKGVDVSNPLAGEINPLLDNRQGGVGEYYTVQVTNQAKGCRNTLTVEIPDNKDFPIVTLSETDNTICAGTKDGVASLATLTYGGAAVASPYTGYSLSWSTGATAVASINQLPAGLYTLTATKDDVGCASAPVQIEVKDNLFIPPLNVALVDQTSCDTSNPNGMLTATVDETPIGGPAVVNTGYSFAWRNNGSTLPLAMPGTLVTTTTATNGQVNQLNGNLYYTIEVTRTITGCVNTETVFLPEVITYPEVVVASTDPVTRCDTPNGAVEANVGGITTGYTFYWLNETGANQTGLNTTVVTNATASFVDNGLYSNLIPGNYTVVAKNNLTTCLSQPITRAVADAIMLTNINVTLGPGFPSTCGSFDGEMTATVTGGSGGTVNLLWHYGGPQNTDINFFNNPPQFAAPNNVPFVTASGQAVPAISHITGLESRLYTLVVQDNGNGCGNYETIFLPFQDAQEIVETLTPSTICPYTIGNGAIDVVVIPPSLPLGLDHQDFSYSLYSGENPDPAKLITPPGTVPGAAATNPMSYSSLAPGKYTIEVTQEFPSFCPVYKVVEIESLALPPLVDIVGALKANTACDVNSSDGSAEITVSQDPNDVTVGFPYSLLVTPSPLLAYTDPIPVAGPYTIAGLKSGNEVAQYSIRVTGVNQCFTERFITIPNQPAIAEMVDGDVVKADAEYCLPALEQNARIEVTNVSIVNGPADDLSDYRFDWYTDANLSANVLSAMGDGSAVEGGEILSNNGISPAPGSPVTVGSYWVVSTKVNPGTTGGVGCFSAPFKVDIDDNTVDPVIGLTPFANTSCDTNYEGQVEVDVSTASGPGVAPATYQYAWTLPAGATAPLNSASNTGVNNLFTGLQDGFYTLVTTNNITGCSATTTTSVVKLEIPVVVAIVDHLDQDFCTPNGQSSVVDVRVNGNLVGNNSYFDFSWFTGSPTAVPSLQGVGVDVFNNLGEGTYYVVAAVDNAAAAGNIPGSGCKSPPVRIDVMDISVNPTVAFTTIANTACDNNFDGQITVLPATPSGPGAASNYDLTWTGIPVGSLVANASDIASPYSTVAPDVVGPGTFTVRVLNRTTQCFVDGTVSVINAPQPVEILTVNKTDQTICYPEGSITVMTTSAPTTVPDYTFRWFRDDPNTTALTDAGNVTITSSLLNNANYSTIGADTYYVVGIKNAGAVVSSGCTTPPFRVEILDLHEDPRVQFAFEPNSSCNPMNPNGVLEANAAEINGSNTDTYSLAWTLDGNPLPAVTTETNTTNSSRLENAFEGNYGVTVTNVSLTGCTFTTNFALNIDQTISLPNIITVDTTDPINCLGSGSAEVTSISIGGGPPISGPVLGTDFAYEWYANNFTPADQLTATTPLLSNLQPGSFFVLVRDLQTDCKSAPTEVGIDDNAIVYPVIDILQIAKQISCSTTMGSAALLATADGQDDSNPDYSFTWYNNLELTQPVFASSSTISNLLNGDYSLEVTNAATGCTSNTIYIIPDDVKLFLPAISLSGQPLTRCIEPFDGGVLARIVNDFQGKLNTPEYPYATLDFTAEFYTGEPPIVDTTQPGQVMTNVPGFDLNWSENGLINGMYTVKITDNNTGCFSVATEEVPDGRVKPVIDIVQDNPLTNCDPLRANGQLSASADGGQVGGYSFGWYGGTAANGAILASNNKLIAQAVGAYTVRVTSDLTGCFDDKTGDIMNATVTPPVPTAVLVRDRTSCLVPNGWVTANVNGATFNYTFDWYDGSVVQGSADFTGIDYLDRDIGPYTVTAMDQVTGCISPPASVQVADKRVIPLLAIEATPSYCLNTGRDATGSVLLTVVNNTEVTLDEIFWYNTNTNDMVGSGSQVFELYPGYYYTNVVSSEGCEATAETEVKTEILSYNLVSVNNDTRNDVWIIDCIDNFPDNNVKVFNRTGVMVYEADGYNNAEVVFRGFGEKGIYISGRVLPDGTYFYIIDKRDGSKPIVGYLELVR